MKNLLSIFSLAIVAMLVLPMSEAEAKRRRRSREPKTSLDQNTYDFSFARQSATCKLGENTVEFMVRGKTFKVSPEEQDLGSPYVFIKAPSKVQLVTKSGKVAVEDGQYKLWPDQNPDSLCTGTLGFAFDQSNALGIGWLDNKNPLVKNLAVAAINTSKNELIGSQVLVGPVQNVELSASGLYVEMAPTEKIAENSEYTELKVWKKVSLRQKHVAVETDLEKTWAKSVWKDQFKNSQEFAKATGWNDKNKKFSKAFVYQAELRAPSENVRAEATENPGTGCVQFAEKPLKSNPCKP